MSTEINPSEILQPIYYLDLKGKVTPIQIRIAARLSDFGIALVPLSIDDLITITKNSIFVVAFCNDFNTYKNFLITRRRFLDMAMMSGKVSLFDISSFSAIHLAPHTKKNGRYKHVCLPISMRELIKEMLIWYTNYHEKKQSWPGGRRAKIPAGE